MSVPLVEFGVLAVVSLVCLGATVRRAGIPGQQPWTVGVLVVGGRATDSNSSRLPRPCGRRGAGEPRGVTVVRLL
jgi:hypothetical protein